MVRHRGRRLALVAAMVSGNRNMMIIFAAVAITRGPSLWRDLERPVRIATGGVWLIFFGFCVPYFYPDAVSLWTVGTYLEPFRP